MKSDPKKGLFSGLRLMRSKLSSSLSAGDRETMLSSLETRLIEADTGTATARSVVAGVRLRSGGKVSLREVGSAIREEIAAVLGNLCGSRPQVVSKPHVVMLVGGNGNGKTTTAAKLAYQAAKRGELVVLAACDTFRAAAKEQLAVWSAELGERVRVVKGGGEPGAVAYGAVSSALAKGDDLVLVDTAGRQTTNKGLMEEVRKISRAIGKALPGAPHETVLALDANTGQNALSQIESFDAALDLTGLVITKLDSTARGGVILTVALSNPKPVLFVGVGEERDALIEFDPGDFAEALLHDRALSLDNNPPANGS